MNTNSLENQEIHQTIIEETDNWGDIYFQGDITQIGQQFIQEDKLDFFEPDFKQYQSPDFISPSKNILDKFVKIIRDEKILVLGGSNHIDKTDFARYLAWYFNQTNKCKVLEWYRSSEPQSIDVKLQEEEKSTIFLLTEVLPQNVGYNLSPIQKAAKSKPHYVIVTTDAPLSSWNFPKEQPVLWQEILPEEIYDEDDLIRVLFQKLKEGSDDSYGKSQQLLKELSQKSADENFIGKLTCRKVAVELQTPDKIALFVELWEKEIEKGDGEPLETKVRQLIDRVKSDEEALNQWYYHLLSHREQLLALGLNFFDGLPDDQFFAALEKIVNNVWQKRDPSLRSLDYEDLDNLRNFFNLTPFGKNEQSRVESRFPQQRRMLFKVAWKSHRRKIVAALDTIAELIQDSVKSKASNQELYATPKRRRELRKVLSETLSDIGWISSFSIRDTLLRLAKDKNSGVQKVAASAISRWRDPNYKCEEKLFEVLKEWQSEFEESQRQSSLDPSINEDGIGDTIAFTVGYAALYDSPNQLDEKLYDLVRKLSENPSDKVQKSFCERTLPNLVSLHFEQIKNLLHDLAENCNLEKDARVKILTQIYLYQRQNLQGANNFTTFKNRRYPVWKPFYSRPLTDVEQLMNNWVKDENPITQEIAMKASVSFACKELELQKNWRQEQEQKNQVAESSSMQEPTVGPITSEPRYELLDRFISWLVTLDRGSYRISLLNVLSEAWKNHKSEPEAMKYVLWKWKNIPDKEKKELKQLSLLLDRGIWVKNYFGEIALVLLSGVALITFWVGVVNYTKNRNVEESSKSEIFVSLSVDGKGESTVTPFNLDRLTRSPVSEKTTF